MSTEQRKLKKPIWRDLILYCDEFFTIINKPAGISTLDDRVNDVDILKLAREQNPEATPGHRLDKETSGVLVIANHAEAYKYFATKLEKREVKKIYHAVVDGVHSFHDFEADEPLNSSGSKTKVERDGKGSLTLIQTLEAFKKHTLLKCYPFSGRMHQIRAHLAHHGAPIVSDGLYGGQVTYLSMLKRNFNLKKFEEENPMIRRMALHAASITFIHPETEVTMTVEAPYPKDFDVLVKQLRKFK
ncbi:MAG: RluA family pseudouridine synthase [Cytophagales bacterium]|nr:RluA family pseudouridine synthase [Cytophagales bacterium]